MKMDLEAEFKKLLEENDGKVMWKKVTKEGLDVDYAVVLPKKLADELLIQLEETVEYFSGELTKVSFFSANKFVFMLGRLVNRRISCLLLKKG